MCKKDDHKTVRSHDLSRRDFLKAAMFTGAAGLLASCGPSTKPTPAPTLIDSPTPAPTYTPASIPTFLPTSIVRRPEIIKFYPDVPKSRIIRTHHAGVWTGTPQGSITDDNDLLSLDALGQMVDASITKLTGIEDARKAWVALFSPDERVAIKVNAYGGSFGGSEVFTHAPLVMSVTQRLQDIGIPPEQIVIYDCATSELAGAGYQINQDGPGVRCYGPQVTQGTNPERDAPGYLTGWQLVGKDIRLSRLLVESDALINMPILKAHSISGMSFAMKSHYGSFDVPWNFHDNVIQAIPELNALAEIKDRTRLVIGDALASSIIPRPSLPYFKLDVVGDSILMSFDPLANDYVGLEMLKQLREEKGYAAGDVNWASVWIRQAAKLGLGANDPANIELLEVKLG